MVFDIYDEKPEKLKRKLAQFYHIRLKRGQVLAIPARDDAIVINVEYEQDAENNIPDICNDISRMYWIDRVLSVSLPVSLCVSYRCLSYCLAE